MKVDHVLILAAGKGTRMGKIGEAIPKVIWPVFEKSILELEYLYAKKFSESIFINVFNYKDKIIEHIIKSSVIKAATILEENEVLDIGGAVHNLANKVNYQGKLLIINSDQFIMLSEDLWSRFYNLSNTFDSALLTYDVRGNELYNSTKSINGKLVEIIPNSELSREKIHETYTGMSIVNLDKLEPQSGESKFFDAVANFKKMNIGTINMKETLYWDFGTTRRYYTSMFNIINNFNKSDKFLDFLKENLAIDIKKVNKASYNSKVNNVINLANQENCVVNSIYLGKSIKVIPDTDCIVFGDFIENINYPAV